MRDARQVLLVGWTLWWCKKISATVDGQVDMSERPAATSNQAFAPAYSAPPSPSTSFTNLKVHTSLNREGSRVLSKRSRPTYARNETDDSTDSKPENEVGQAAVRDGRSWGPYGRHARIKRIARGRLRAGMLFGSEARNRSSMAIPPSPAVLAIRGPPSENGRPPSTEHDVDAERARGGCLGAF